MASSGSSSTSSGTFAPGSLGSDPVSGDLRVARARVLGQRVDLPPRPRTVGTHRTGPRFPSVRCAQVGGGGHRPFVLLLRHTHGFSVLLSGKTVLCQGARCGGRAAGGGGRGAGGGGGGSVCCAGMRPFIFTSSCGNGSPGALWLCRLQWLPLHRGLVPPAFRQAFRGPGFASASFPSLPLPLPLPPSDGKHGLCSCQPREARLPPTGIVMEGNLGAAPLRRLHGMPPPPPRRVETRGGGPQRCCGLHSGWVGFLAAFALGPGPVSCLLAGVPCLPAWGGGGGCPHHPCLSAWLSGCRQATS